MFKCSWLTLPATIAVFWMLAAPARASVTYSLQSVTSSSPGTGSFEVDLTNTTGSAITVASFDFGLSMPNASFTITAVNCTTAVHAYLFASDSATCPTLNSNTLPSTTLNAGDFCNLCTGNGTTLANGATLAIGEIFFSIAGGVTPGVYTVSFIPGLDSVADVTGASLGPVNDSGTGTITVTTAATPEPSTMALFGLTLLPLFWVKKRARS